MKIKGMTKIIKDLTDAQEIVNEKIDNIDWDKPTCDEKDERLNQAWDAIDDALADLKDIDNI